MDDETLAERETQGDAGGGGVGGRTSLARVVSSRMREHVHDREKWRKKQALDVLLLCSCANKQSPSYIPNETESIRK